MSKRLLIGPAALLLICALARPASAAPITFSFDGLVNYQSQWVDDFFPDLANGTAFNGTFSFSDDTPGLWNMDLTFGNYEAGGYGGYNPAIDSSTGVSLYTAGQHMMTPTGSGKSIRIDWINIALNAGWNTGQIEFFGESPLVPGFAVWRGDISVQTPEPATIALSLLGLGSLGLVRRARASAAQMRTKMRRA